MTLRPVRSPAMSAEDRFSLIEQFAPGHLRILMHGDGRGRARIERAEPDVVCRNPAKLEWERDRQRLAANPVDSFAQGVETRSTRQLVFHLFKANRAFRWKDRVRGPDAPRAAHHLHQLPLQARKSVV